MNTKLMMMIISTSSMLSKHPLTMGSLLITQTMMICMNLTLKISSPWYSYILFITMIGGMMIMFIYMASIMSNKIFSIKKSLLIIMVLFSIINLMDIDATLMTMYKMMETKFNMMKMEESKTLVKFFNMNKLTFTLMMMLTLLISLISITNITNSKEGPLKKTYV